MLDLHRLRLLRELKVRGTLAAVAQALSFSPSAVSQQLSQLEAETGVRLLERVGRGVVLTDQAEILVRHAEELLAGVERAEADLAASLDVVAGTVRLATFQTAAHGLVPRALTILAGEHPALRVEVTELEPDRALPALLARDFDVVLGEEYPDHPHRPAPGIDVHELCLDPLGLALPPGAEADLTDLVSRPWVLELDGSPARHWAESVCRKAGFEPDVRYRSSDVLFHLRLVEAGLAVGFVPGLAWSSSSPIVLGSLPGDPSRRVFAGHRSGAGRHPAVAAVRKALHSAVRSRGVEGLQADDGADAPLEVPVHEGLPQ